MNPSRVIYGMIAIGALLAAESGHHEGYADTVLSAVIAASLFWLVHSYAEVLAQRLTRHERLTARALRHALAQEWPLMRGAGVPLLVIGIAWAAGAPHEAAVTAALWSVVASIVAFELAAGIRSRATPGELALDVCVGALLGLGILALKILLH